jgi:hypothetical protein
MRALRTSRRVKKSLRRHSPLRKKYHDQQDIYPVVETNRERLYAPSFPLGIAQRSHQYSVFTFIVSNIERTWLERDRSTAFRRPTRHHSARLLPFRSILIDA